MNSVIHWNETALGLHVFPIFFYICHKWGVLLDFFFFLSCTESSVLWTRKPVSDAFAVGENWDQRGDLFWVLWHDRWGHLLKRRKVGGRGNPSRLYRKKKNYPPFSTSNNMGRKKKHQNVGQSKSGGTHTNITLGSSCGSTWIPHVNISTIL